MWLMGATCLQRGSPSVGQQHPSAVPRVIQEGAIPLSRGAQWLLCAQWWGVNRGQLVSLLPPPPAQHWGDLHPLPPRSATELPIKNREGESLMYFLGERTLWFRFMAWNPKCYNLEVHFIKSVHWSGSHKLLYELEQSIHFCHHQGKTVAEFWEIFF